MKMFRVCPQLTQSPLDEDKHTTFAFIHFIFHLLLVGFIELL